MKRSFGGVVGFFSGSTAEKARYLLTATLLATLPAILLIAPFSAVRRVLTRGTNVLKPLVTASPSAHEITGVVERTDWHLPGERKCLVRSLTTETLLRLYGYTPSHRIGVDKEADGEIKAHSWIEYDGEILIGDLENLSRYQRLPPLDGRDET